MTTRTIKLYDTTILIVGSLHSNLKKVPIINEIAKEYSLLIVIGGAFHEKYFELELDNNIIYCFDEKDLIGFKNNENYKHTHLLDKYPVKVNVLINSSRYIICSGNPINSSNPYSVAFFNQTYRSNWHNKYSGNNGYAVTNSPINNYSPKFYNYSCSIGHKYKIFAQELSKFGLDKTIEI